MTDIVEGAQGQDQSAQAQGQAVVSEDELDAVFNSIPDAGDTSTAASGAPESGSAADDLGGGEGAGNGGEGASGSEAQPSATGGQSGSGPQGSAPHTGDEKGAAPAATSSEGAASPAQKAAASKTAAPDTGTQKQPVDNSDKTLNGRLRALARENAQLRNKQPASAPATGSTGAGQQGKTDSPVLEKVKSALAPITKDYPEIAGSITQALEVVDEAQASTRNEVQADKARMEAVERAKIVDEAHPDGGKLVRTPEFAAWRETQPAYVRAMIEANGQGVVDADAVIDILNRFKVDTGIAAQAAPGNGNGAAAPQNNQTADDIRRARLNGAGAVPPGKGGKTTGLPEDPDALFDHLARTG